jgi:hypothetical protein
MNSHTAAAIGIISAAVNIAGTVPYVIDIFRGKTKPERAMWWIYSFLFSILFAAQLQAGARWLLVVTAVYVMDSLLIAVLSLKYGYGRLHKRDIVSAVVAVLGLLLWQIADSPLIAIVMVIVVDFAGFWLTLAKTWHAPRSETLIAWQLSLGGAFLSIFAIQKWDPAVYLYPAYAVAGTAFIVWIIMYRRKIVAVDATDF